MKREEALAHIVNVLQLTGNHYCEDGRDLVDADRILTRLENIGMLPSKYVNPKAKKEYAELIEKKGITWAYIKYIDDYGRAWEKPYDFYLSGWEDEEK
jgi:hypothetical protein